MSIFHMSSLNQAMDYGCIQSLDLTVQNIGDRGFDILVQVIGPNRVILLTLNSLSETYSSVTVRDVATSYAPFEVQLVTNIRNPDTVTILLETKNQGIVLGRYTQHQFAAIY